MRSALPRAGGTQYTWHWQTSFGRIRKQLDHIVYGSELELVDAARVALGELGFTFLCSRRSAPRRRPPCPARIRLCVSRRFPCVGAIL